MNAQINRLAITTDDGHTISGHFGRARFYEVISIADGQVVSRERREKPGHHSGGDTSHGPHGHAAEHSGGHGHHGNHHHMIAPILDCQVVVTAGMGEGAWQGLQAAGMTTIVTPIRVIDDAVQAYLQGTLENHLDRVHSHRQT
jgi:predicted Fe-Mo cluster-binding NifX family protein